MKETYNRVNRWEKKIVFEIHIPDKYLGKSIIIFKRSSTSESLRCIVGKFRSTLLRKSNTPIYYYNEK